MRTTTLAMALCTFALALSPALARAQTAAPTAPALPPLDAQELAALRPLAARGLAVIVRGAAEGVHARTTLLTRSHAPLAVVHDVIATPEHYAEFLDGIDHTEITARFQNRIAFRLHTDAGIFSSDTIGSLHLVNPQRIDGLLTQSQLGPGQFRWDLYPDGDDTLIVYTTTGDPTQVNWFLRALIRGDPSTIAGIQMSYHGILALAVGLRSERLAGNAAHSAYETNMTTGAASTPPPLGPWAALAHDNVVGVATLDAGRSPVGSTVAMWVASTPDAVRDRLVDVDHYPQHLPYVRSLERVPNPGGPVRFRTVVDSPLAHTEGDQDLLVASGATGPVVTWQGVSGDYVHVDHRWDAVNAIGGGTIVLLTGGVESNGAGMVMRAVQSMAHWITIGYSLAWKMLWMRPMLAGL